MTDLRYAIGNSGQILIFTLAALECFAKHRQINASDPEGGGQLFAKFHSSEIHIVAATEPRPEDKRHRFYFFPSKWALQREIKEYHRRGLHYVGDWHTHPEQNPIPSTLDLQSMQDCFLRSKHKLNWFVMAIVGLSDFPAGLSVTVHNGSEYLVLMPTE